MKNYANVEVRGIEFFLLKYIVIFYPLLISLGRFIPFVETILTLMMLFVLGLDCIVKRKLYIKYIVIALLFIGSARMDIQTENHIAHIKVLLIFFLAIDCYNNGLYEKIAIYIEKNHNLL